VKTIPLTQGQVAVVSNRDFVWLSAFTWYAKWDSEANTFYAYRMSPRDADGKQHSISMHRAVMGLFYGDGGEVDHWDNNGLHNNRRNLRISTHSQNQQNQRMGSVRQKSSRFRHVLWHSGNKRWNVQISANGKRHNLGYFDDETEAAKVADRWAKRLCRRFAKLNFQNE
jgi:hypothetical protein